MTTTYQPTGKTYKLATIRDIYEQLTAEQIPVCLQELATLLSTTKAMVEAINTIAGIQLGKDGPAELVQMPDAFEWTDDGKGELTTHVMAGDEELARLEIRRDQAAEEGRPE